MVDPAPRNSLRTYLIGLCMGTADAVPGVSGGTIALLLGIYDRLIAALTGLTPQKAREAIETLTPPTDRRKVTSLLNDIDAVFLLALGCGILTAVILVGQLVDYADTHYPTLLFGFFFGLIGASAIVLSRQVSLSQPQHFVAAISGCVLAFVLSGDHTFFASHSSVLIFIAGAIAISAMILPGISGSLILVILGQYTYLLEALSQFTSAIAGLLTGGTVDRVLVSGQTVGIFLSGAVIGLVTISRVVNRALEADRRTTLVFLISLVVGALRAPITEINSREAITWSVTTTLEFGVMALCGAVLLIALDYFAGDIDTAPEALEQEQRRPSGEQ